MSQDIDIVDLDLTPTLDTLKDCARWDATTAQRALAGAGRQARMLSTGHGLQTKALVTLVEWRPAFGRSRWLVRDAAGREATVAAARLSDPRHA